MSSPSPCGTRINPERVQLMPTSFDGCDRDATHQVGETRWLDVDTPRRASTAAVLACAEHVEAAKAYWRRRERLDPDREATVRQLRLL